MDWLARGFHGDMAYMASHGLKRARPAELVPGTLSVITARMDYLPRSSPDSWQTLELSRLHRSAEGTVSLYARGRDYHKVLRSRLQKLADKIAVSVGPMGYRVFTDSAPVLEAELASRSGQGWRGKHTLLLNRDAGSMFFLGEIYIDIALPPTEPVQDHCGACSACITACPTQAIVAPGQVDARRCISYLTIEHDGAIPEPLRAALGNRWLSDRGAAHPLAHDCPHRRADRVRARSAPGDEDRARGGDARGPRERARLAARPDRLHRHLPLALHGGARVAAGARRARRRTSSRGRATARPCQFVGSPVRGRPLQYPPCRPFRLVHSVQL